MVPGSTECEWKRPEESYEEPKNKIDLTQVAFSWKESLSREIRMEDCTGDSSGEARDEESLRARRVDQG